MGGLSTFLALFSLSLDKLLVAALCGLSARSPPDLVRCALEWLQWRHELGLQLSLSPASENIDDLSLISQYKQENITRLSNYGAGVRQVPVLHEDRGDVRVHRGGQDGRPEGRDVRLVPQVQGET